MKGIRRTLLPLLLLLSSGLVGCERDPASVSPRLVVLYAPCTVNKDLLGPYSSAVEFTTAFDRLAKDGVVFERHQTEAGQSGIAFASLLSGNLADRHSVFFHPNQIRSDAPLITESFASEGWEVHAWLKHVMADAELGYAAGTPPENQYDIPLRADDERFVDLLARLQNDPEARAFVVTNFTLTHAPYSPRAWTICERAPNRCAPLRHPSFQRLRQMYHAHFREMSWDFEATTERLGLGPDDTDLLIRTVDFLYEASIVDLDLHLDAVMKAIDEAGLSGETILAVTADHGETRFAPEAPFHWSHGFQLASPVLNVPWILRAPGVAPGRYPGVTRSIDVYPTLVGLAGLRSVPDVAGVDLSRTLRGEEPPPELTAVSHTSIPPTRWWRKVKRNPIVKREIADRGPRWIRVGIREDDTFYEFVPNAEGRFETRVFDLATDPAKTRNLFDPESSSHQDRSRQLRDLKRHFIESYRVSWREHRGVDPAEQAKRLRALGYIE